MFGAIESTNIVGYNSNNKTDKQYSVVGHGFVTVGAPAGKKVFMLSDIKPAQWSSSADILQLMSDVNARTLASWAYFSKAEAEANGVGEEYVGWWDSEMQTQYTGDNDIEFDLGAGFKVNGAAKDVKLQNVGKVNTEATEIDLRGKQYVPLANILPRDIRLGDIVGIGTESSADIVQELSDVNASTTEMYVYFSAAEATANELTSDYVGWWTSDFTERADDVQLNAGDAFWCNLSAKNARFAFPSATSNVQ